MQFHNPNQNYLYNRHERTVKILQLLKVYKYPDSDCTEEDKLPDDDDDDDDDNAVQDQDSGKSDIHQWMAKPFVRLRILKAQ